MLVALPLALGGCGSDEPSGDDVETIRGLLSSSAEIQRAMSDLYVCLPEQPRCYREGGPAVVAVVERERAAFEEALTETDDECLAEAGDLYADSLDAYGAAGRAAARGRPGAVDRAIDRSTESELAFLAKVGDCGFAQGRYAEAGAAMRRVDADLLRLSTEMDACGRERCVAGVARRMEGTAREGLAVLDDFLRELRAEADVPACLPASLGDMRTAFQSLARMSRALQDGDFETAEREGERAAERTATAQADLADCLGTLED